MGKLLEKTHEYMHLHTRSRMHAHKHDASVIVSSPSIHFDVIEMWMPYLFVRQIILFSRLLILNTFWYHFG